MLLFPEGGRTCSGTPHIGVINTCLVDRVGENGNSPKIRPFTKGAALLAIQTQAMVIPVWVEGTDAVSPNINVVRYPFPRLWKRVTIVIGMPIIFPADAPVETATHELEKAVLGLAHSTDSIH
jgi:1-acyl-sn-glycerol-3-phosphate acyltransferase